MFKKVLIFTMTTFALGVGVVFCYDNINTHPLLSRTAVQVYNNSTNIDKINIEQANWIEYGSVNEDADPRYLNHFYNPKTGQGLRDGVWFGMSTKDWAQRQLSITGDYAYQAIIDNYKNGDKKRAWQGVGHMLHLIQDMSVPAHVRNDGHSEGDLYEAWAEKFGSVQTSGMPKISVNSLNHAFDSLANFTSDNFFSKDTIIKNDKKINTGAIKTEKDINNEDASYVYFNNYKLIKVKSYIGGDEYSIDYNVNQSYWSILAPKAIGYSAGVIELFAKEFKKIDDQKEAQYLTMTWMQRRENELRSLMDPILSLGNSAAYYWGDTFMALRPTLAGEGQAMLAAVGLAGSAIEKGGELVVDAGKAIANQTISAGSVLGEKILAGDGAQAATASSTNDKEKVKIAVVNTQKKIEDAVKVKRVIDGDTIELSTGEKVRYIGVDSPELNDAGSADDECLAWAAKVRNEQLVQSGKILLVADNGADKDGYGRLLRYAYAGNTFINAQLAVEGFARTLFCQAGWKNCPVMNDAVRKKIILDAGAQAAKNKRGIYSSICESEVVKLIQGPELMFVRENEVQPMVQEIAKGVSTFVFNNNSNNNDNELDVVIITDADIINDEGATTTEEAASSTPEVATSSDEIASSSESEATSTDEVATTTEPIDINNIHLILYDLETSNEMFTASTTIGVRINGVDVAVEYYLTQDDAEISEDVEWSGFPEFFLLEDNDDFVDVYLWIKQDGSILNENIRGEIILDREAPEIILNRTPELIVDSNEAVFDIFCDDNAQEYFDGRGIDEKVTTWNYKLDDGEWLIGDNDEDIIFQNLADGNHVLSVEAVDRALNLATTSYSWTIDSALPELDMQADHIVISEIQIGVTGSSTDEFIELYNPTDQDVNLSDYRLVKKTAATSSDEFDLITSFASSLNQIIYAHGFFLISPNNQVVVGDNFTDVDAIYTVGRSGNKTISENNTIILYNAADLVDKVGYGSVADFEGRALVNIALGKSVERKHLHDSTAESMNDISDEKYLGNGYDSDNNYYDFVVRNIPDPQSSSDAEEPRIPHYAQ